MATSLEPEFVQDLSVDEICAICYNVLESPILTGCCGQHYCKECLKKWLKVNSNCPHCRTKSFNYIKSIPKKQEIDSLKIYCPNRVKGCEEVIPYSDCQKHLETCLFVEVECKCKQMVLRKDLQDHLSNRCSHHEVECIYCKASGMCKDINSEKHFDECSSYPLPCPNSCGQNIPRKDIDTHRENCPLQPVQCPFSEAGCGDVPRKDLDAHIDSSTQHHLALVMGNVTTLQQSTATLQQNVTGLQQSFETIGSSVLKELDSVSADKESTRAVHCIKTTLLSVTTMLEKDKQYCLGMPWNKTQDSVLPGDIFSTGMTARIIDFLRTLGVIRVPAPADPYARLIVIKSDSFYVKPGYKLSIQTHDGECIGNMAIYLERGDMDNQVQWPMEPMELTLENKRHQEICTFSICTQCSSCNLNRVKSAEKQRQLKRAKLRNQSRSDLLYLYIQVTHHQCKP